MQDKFSKITFWLKLPLLIAVIGNLIIAGGMWQIEQISPVESQFKTQFWLVLLLSNGFYSCFIVFMFWLTVRLQPETRVVTRKTEIDIDRMRLLTTFLKNYYSADVISSVDAQTLIDASLLTSVGYVGENTKSWSEHAYDIINNFEGCFSMTDYFKKLKQ